MLSIGELKPISSQEWFPFWEDVKKISKSTSLPHQVQVLRFWLMEHVWGRRIIVIWGRSLQNTREVIQNEGG
jgi:hypothetical protein